MFWYNHIMNNSLNSHLGKELQWKLSQEVIDEVIAMFSNEATALIDQLSSLKPTVRDIVLGALREYHTALDTNTTVFADTAQILPWYKTEAANNDFFQLSAQG